MLKPVAPVMVVWRAQAQHRSDAGFRLQSGEGKGIAHQFGLQSERIVRTRVLPGDGARGLVFVQADG